MHRTLSLAAAVAILGAAGLLRADVFELTNDGKIEGQLVNKDETPRTKYVIRTEDGGEITVDAKQVKHIEARNPAEAEYEKVRGEFPDTVEGQLKLAQWCSEKRLAKQRQTALERVIQIDPDNKQARGALDFAFVDGKWVHGDEAQKQKGYVKYKGQWMLPQQVELLEQGRKDDQARAEWFRKIKRWRSSVDARPDHWEGLRDELLAIKDPTAIAAISQQLGVERVAQVKVALLKSLADMGVPSGITAVVDATLEDPDEEVRLSAIDILVESPNHSTVTATYVKALKSADNKRVNRAAMCLGKLKDKSAISPLIDALITNHKFKEVSSAQPGQTTTTFSKGPGGAGGGGLAVGGGPKVFHLDVKNPEVLRALETLVDGAANFEYDVPAWKSWFASQKKPVNVDTRRG